MLNGFEICRKELGVGVGSADAVEPNVNGLDAEVAVEFPKRLVVEGASGLASSAGLPKVIELEGLIVKNLLFEKFKII